MKIATVVGARPQFIKAAVVSRALRGRAREILVHTGQHYDRNMSEIFFEELDIPKPNYNLGISGGSHAQMTGRMMEAVEGVLLREKPDAVLVYGDTNSTLAAALTAAKLQIPLCHVEAGARVGTRSNPEEVNRICTDHVSDLLLYCTRVGEEHLRREGLLERSYLVGDPMYDAFLYYGGKLTSRELENIVGLDGGPVRVPEKFYYMTCHRQENTDDDRKLREILKAMNSLDAPTVYPVHPRNHDSAVRICAREAFDNVLLTQPVGYLSSIALVTKARKIVTDSGGLQREAFFAEKQCVTIFDRPVWPETMVGNRNQISEPDAADILNKLSRQQTVDADYKPFGDGHAGERIADMLIDKLGS